MDIRKALFQVHLSAGLLAGGLILSMAVSGALLAFEPQIVEWAERDRRVVAVPPGGPPRLSLDALAARASEASRKGRLSGITLRSDPAASAVAAFGREGGSLYLDPYSGAVLGADSRTHAFLHRVEEWHRWLGSREAGKPVTGAACLLFLFLLCSGLCLWRPRRWTRSALRASCVPDLRLKGRARDWNWHNAVGLWAAPLLLVTTVTGTIIAYRWAGDLLFVLAGNGPPPRPAEEGPKKPGAGPDPVAAMAGGGGPSSRRASLDTLFARAEAKVPGWAAITLRLPRKPGGPVTASIIEPGFTRRHARSQLALDAATAEVRKWEPYAEQNLGRKLRAQIVPVHTGRAGGIPGQALALLSACAAALMVWTGAAMAWRRFFPSRAGRTVWRFLVPGKVYISPARDPAGSALEKTTP